MSPIGAGSVNTTWKYGTGSRSASREASQSFAAAPWHFGQCRLRQLLYEIWVCAHFSQRATCPPRAAVRQLSIADIVFNLPRATGAIELARRHRLHAVAPWKQPALRSCRPPPGAQQFEQMWRQHHVAVFAAFALLDANDHAFAVDVADLERDHLGSAQTRAISHAQRGLVFEPWCCIQQARHFLRTEQ